MKHIYNRISWMLVAFLFLLITSCEKEVDIELNSVPARVAIEGEIRMGTLARVRVSHTIDFDDNSGYPIIEDAVVTISDNKGNSETLTLDNFGWYTGKTIIGEESTTYSLSVSCWGETYTATSFLPPRVEVQGITWFVFTGGNDNTYPRVHFTDPVGDANIYYRCLLYVNGVHYADKGEQLVDAEYTDGSSQQQLIMYDDDDYDKIKDGDEVLIELQCIDKGAYTFFDTWNMMEFTMANPTTNIRGGALGYFYAYSYHRLSAVAQVD